jgi:circadian clock protein KaiC
VLQSGNKELDALLGGGIDYGTSVLLIGPAGSGKSSLATLYARAAAERGDRAALFVFDERVEVLRARAAGLGMDLAPHLESGHLTAQPVDPAELSPGEFAHAVCDAVEPEAGRPGARVVVIDSLNGYLQAMPEERFLTAQMHELLTYLGHRGVVTFLVLAQHGLVGPMRADVDTTYLADTVLMLRYFEAAGEVRQALAVIKKRTGKHERALRELRLDGSIRVGEPLRDFQGVLTGAPRHGGPPRGAER